MGRWEQNARGRLAQAALTRYAEQGFEQTTVAVIARAAGLTERTFFRHFADNREVLFYGTDAMRDLMVRVIGDAPPAMAALDTIGLVLQVMGTLIQENRDIGALRGRRVPGPAASLAAEMGIAVYKVAFARWISEPGDPDLPLILRESVAELRDVLAGTLPSRA